MFMKKMKLSVKLIGSFCFVSMMLLIGGYIGIANIKNLTESIVTINQVNTKPMAALGEVGVLWQEQRAETKNAYIQRFVFDKDITAELEKIAAFNKRGEKAMSVIDLSVMSPEINKEYENLIALFIRQNPNTEKLLKMMANGQRDETTAFMNGEVTLVDDRITESMKKIIDLEIKQADATIQESVSRAKAATWFVSIATLIFFLLSLGIGFLLSAMITRPINHVVEGLSDGADQVASASNQVSSSSQQLAEGTSEQAASLEETSSSIEELSSMTKQNADNAGQAKAMMEQAGQIVGKVDQHMTEMIDAMEEIKKSSDETGKILKTIDEIAFQTNLLALNAAVEAARAGEAGAGFAVVADEVRNLAMRSAEAAKNTNNLIEGTIKAVKNGNELTHKTKEAFEENRVIAMKIGQLVDEIATASNEQAHGIAQINIAVSEMDKVTQSTAANAEESASASEELSAQAEQMKVFVEELVRVVGGNSDAGAAYAYGGSPKRKHRSSGQISGAVNRPLLPTTGGRGKEPALVAEGKDGRGKVVNPRQIIPLEESEFKDF